MLAIPFVEHRKSCRHPATLQRVLKKGYVRQMNWRTRTFLSIVFN
jgi:hypothetical protein